MRNQWAYVDSVYTLLVPEGQLRIESIESYTGESEHGSWICNNINPFGTGSVKYSISNDTVFIDDGWTNPAVLNPRVAFLPSGVVHDTMNIPIPFSAGLKVYPLGNDMLTPAGRFDSVYVYENDGGNGERALTYFRSGVGVIFEEVYLKNNVLELRSVLTAYILQP